MGDVWVVDWEERRGGAGSGGIGWMGGSMIGWMRGQCTETGVGSVREVCMLISLSVPSISAPISQL